MKKIEIVGYPQGNILKVTQKQFDFLNENDLISFDDEWTKENPNGQWGFNNDDEDEIENIIKNT